MTKTLLAATTALALMGGVALAQSTETTTTTTTTPPVAVVPAAPVVVPAPTHVIDTMRQRTIDQNGVVREETRTTGQGVAPTPYGDTTTTRQTDEVHTVQ
jgi:hypothetical protein